MEGRRRTWEKDEWKREGEWRCGFKDGVDGGLSGLKEMPFSLDLGNMRVKGASWNISLVDILVIL